MHRTRRMVIRKKTPLTVQNHIVVKELRLIRKNQSAILSLLASMKKEQKRLALQIGRNSDKIDTLAEQVVMGNPKKEIVVDSNFQLPSFPLSHVTMFKRFDNFCQKESNCDQLVSNN